MKIKGIPVWEQHIEKFILGGFGLVLLGVGAMQVLTRPNEVPMEGKPAGPAEIEAALKARADAVAAKLNPNAAAPAIVDGEIPSGAFDAFRAQVDGGVSPRTTLPSVAPALAAAILPSEAAVDAGRFHEPAFGAPVMQATRQEADTLDESALQQTPELADILKEHFGDRFGGDGAKDITWLVPTGSIDLREWRAELRKALPNAKPPELAIPTLWYNDALWLVDVVFERQERISQNGGNATWSDPTVVAVLPGQFSFRKEIGNAGVDLRDEMYRLLAQKDKVLQILQPQFLPTKGSTFSPALILGKDDEKDAGANPELRRLKQQYDRKSIEAERTLAEVKDLGGPCEPKGEDRERDRRRDDEDRGRGGDDGGGAKAPGGGGLGGGGMSGGKNNSGRSKEEEEKCVRLTRKWKELDSQVKKLEEEIKRLSPATDLSASGNVVDLAKDDSLLVWAHDIWVKPGATYRYRCRVDLYNPFFARKRQLIPEQQKLSDPFVIGSKTSGWGTPVTVEPPVRFFVTDASEGGGRLGLGSAKIELYRFYDGQRRSETITVQPGDRIGGVVERRREGVTVDFTTDWFVVDIVDDGGGERQKSGHVVLRRADDPTLVIRMPVADAASSDRERFMDEVEAARDAASKPADKGDKPEDPADGGSPRGGPGGGFGGPAGK